MQPDLRDLLTRAGGEPPPPPDLDEAWRRGRASRRHRRMVSLLGGAAAVTAVVLAVSQLPTPSTSTVASPRHSAPPGRQLPPAALPEDLPPEPVERWAPSVEELARIEAGAHRGIRPPTREGAAGPEVLISTVDGTTAWVTLPPWIPPESLEATPGLSATAGSAGTPRTFLTTAPNAAIQTARCPFADGRCEDDHVQRDTGVGEWTAIFRSPAIELSKRIAKALVFTPGPAGYIQVSSRSNEVRLGGQSVSVGNGRTGVDVNTKCHRGAPDARVVRGDGSPYFFCADGFEFFLAFLPRSKVQAYAETIVVRRLS